MSRVRNDNRCLKLRQTGFLIAFVGPQTPDECLNRLDITTVNFMSNSGLRERVGVFHQIDNPANCDYTYCWKRESDFVANLEL